MSRTLRPAVLLALLIATLLCATATALNAPSLLPGMPDEIASIRIDRLTTTEYEALAEEWRAYLSDHPKSAVAEVQLGRALRYADAPADEVREHYARALKLDPECPEALDTAASTYLGEWEPLADDAAGCYALGQEAVALAPDWPEPHFTLWPLALLLGRQDDADAHVKALVKKGGVSAPVLDYCYNMLTGADANAIIFTNGDNDTYGSCGLQAGYGLRRDVYVLNLSLLNQPDIEEALFARFGDHSPLSADERRTMRDEFKKNYVRDRELYSTKVVKAVAAKVASGAWDGPVYIALTVHHQVLDACPQPRRIEGLLWRLVRDGDTEGDAGTDVEKTWTLFDRTYRLDSATDHAFPWSRRRSVASLMDNYPGVLARLAAAAGEKGDTETMRAAYRLGLEVARFHGRDGTVASLAEYWQDLDPDNPEIQPWLSRENE